MSVTAGGGSTGAESVAPVAPPGSAPKQGGSGQPPRRQIDLPFLLDFYPLEDPKQTRIHQFFTFLRQGRFTTTRCTKCRHLMFAPRVVCPACLSDALEWEDLPRTGRLYAFTSLVLGAPLTLEQDAPFPIGVVELDQVGLRIMTRIDDAQYQDLELGMPMEFKPVDLPDGRVHFRFRPLK